MNVLYVYAHPERKSFNAKLRDLALEVLAEQGHEVVLSDLHAMNFEAVHSRQDFTTERDADAFRYGREQSFAAKNAGFARDVKGEIDKLRACDMLIMQFPLWWFSVPAILKGWIDRTYAVGAIYDHEHFYDRGYLVGKRAMLAVTMGAAETDMRGDGFHGDVLVNLWPIHNGCLYYIGMEVLPPFVAWAGTFGEEATQRRHLAAYRERLTALESTEPLFFHSRDDYGPDNRLKPGITARTIAQRNLR